MMRTIVKAEEKQSINGILLVNKPLGMTSNAVLQKVKRLLNAKKAGHTGSLDPMATGMLPICFGEATKFCQYLLDADKCYETTGRLGVKTTTGDATGQIICQLDDFLVDEQQLRSVLEQFKGKINQIPSMYSALKFQGTPLYKYARAGVEIARVPREVTIYQLQLNSFHGTDFCLTVSCSKGTYIRNLVEDIGAQLGVNAHVMSLHRNYCAGFADEPMYSIDELTKQSMLQRQACLLPIERAVSYLPKLVLTSEEVQVLRYGKILNNIDAHAMRGHVRLYHQEQDREFIGLGEINELGIIKVKRLLSEDLVNHSITY
ncbi:MAG: tRNA pseudouridine(55) synthase TruB [Legionella sp.]